MNPEDRLRQLRDPDRWTNVRLPKSHALERTAQSVSLLARPSAIFGGLVAVAAVAGIYLGLTGLGGAHEAPAPAAPSSSQQAARVASPSPTTTAPTPTTPTSVAASGLVCNLHSLNVKVSSSGAGAGSWVALLDVSNSGPTCTLQPSDVRVGTWDGRAAQAAHRTGFTIPAGKTITLSVFANTTCPSGTMNIASRSTTAPLTLRSGGQTKAAGAFPKLSCSGPAIGQM